MKSAGDASTLGFIQGIYMSSHFLSETKKQEIENLVHSGKKIPAIKVYRDETGASLAESKSFIDSIALEGVKEKSFDPFSESTGNQVEECGEGLTDAIQQEIAELMDRGQKLHAVKTYRLATGASLRESKEYVERLHSGDAILPGVSSPLSPRRNNEKKTNETHPQVHSTGCGSSVIVFFLVASAALTCVYLSLTA
ncbi:MAG: hypothetical protein MI807_14800 [Verrucomicrobiales bacterium]|nr:hypothetical protein [Verrucomicrobiales bacterium]